MRPKNDHGSPTQTFGDEWRKIKDAAQWRALIILAGIIILLLKTAYMSGTGDWLPFYIAARRFRLGLNPYNAWVLPKGYSFGFPYPPLGLFLLVGPSFFPFITGMWIWDLMCLELYVVTVFLWFKMIWGRAPSLREFSLTLAASCAPFTFIAFAAHHLILPVLFFITAAFYVLAYRKNDFFGGLLTGAMFLKPHMVVLPALMLFQKARSKTLFLAGGLILVLGTLAPFMNLYRPVKDLTAMMSRHEVTRTFFKDEQGLGALFLQNTFYRGLARQDTLRSASGFYAAGSQAVHHYSVEKFSLTLASWFLWTLFLRRQSVVRPPDLYIAAITVGLLTAVYSHIYDSVLALPFVLQTVHRLNRIYDLSTIACYGIIFHLASLYALSVWYAPNGIYWPWLSAATIGACWLLSRWARL